MLTDGNWWFFWPWEREGEPASFLNRGGAFPFPRKLLISLVCTRPFLKFLCRFLKRKSPEGKPMGQIPKNKSRKSRKGQQRTNRDGWAQIGKLSRFETQPSTVLWLNRSRKSQKNRWCTSLSFFLCFFWSKARNLDSMSEKEVFPQPHPNILGKEGKNARKTKQVWTLVRKKQRDPKSRKKIGAPRFPRNS